MDSDTNKVIAAILTTMCRRDNSIPSVEQVVLTYERMLRALNERDEQDEG